MTMRDDLGLAVSGADADSLSHYQTALTRFQCYVGIRWPRWTPRWRGAPRWSWPMC